MIIGNNNIFEVGDSYIFNDNKGTMHEQEHSILQQKCRDFGSKLFKLDKRKKTRVIFA